MATIKSVAPGRVVIKLNKRSKSSGGITLPSGSQDQTPGRGVVTHVGAKLVNATGTLEPPCKVGDTIAYGYTQFGPAGQPLNLVDGGKLEEADHIILGFTDVLAVLGD